jgi:hypothetical protein
MKKIDWDHIRREKEIQRERLAKLPVAEKFRIVERLRDASRELRGWSSTSKTILPMSSASVRVSLLAGHTTGEIHVDVFGVNPVLGNALLNSNASLTNATTPRSNVRGVTWFFGPSE